MPNHVTPLAGHPQLETITTQLPIGTQDQVTEYRVHNYSRWNNGTIVRGDGFGWVDWLWLVGLVLASRWMRWDVPEGRLFARSLRNPSIALWVIAFMFFVVRQCTKTLYQSIIALPDLGVQLQTVRGISLPLPGTRHRHLIPLATSSTFIPLSQISTIIINEGLRRWRVEYYLAIAKNRDKGIMVVYDTVRPPVAVLKEVYHGLREQLFDEFDE